MMMNTIALVISGFPEHPELVEILSEESDILYLESAIMEGEEAPLEKLYKIWEGQEAEEDDFGDFVENLLTQTNIGSEIQDHAKEWLNSRMKIEKYEKMEREAASVIARFAFDIFKKDPSRTDFVLVGADHRVRVRVLCLPNQDTVEAA